MNSSKIRLLIFVILLFVISLICFLGNNEAFHKKEVEVKTKTAIKVEDSRWVSTTVKINSTSPPKNKRSSTTNKSKDNNKAKSKIKLDEDDEYLLAKIAMAEAEGQSTKGKALVMCVVINRVLSNEFPDSVYDVIYDENQFSPISNGRFDRVEPNKDCYKSLDMIKSGWDESNGALYFESCKGKSWHSENLKFLFKVDEHRFYK